jgi:hypothetical protein
MSERARHGNTDTRALDEWIGREVFKAAPKWHGGAWYAPAPNRDGTACPFPEVMRIPSRGYWHDTLPRFSASFEAAFSLVDAMEAEGWAFELHRYDDTVAGARRWRAEFARAIPEFGERCEYWLTGDGYSDESVPEAIALAARDAWSQERERRQAARVTERPAAGGEE